MKLPGVVVVDLILFWGLIGTIGVAHSLLLTTGTPWQNVTWFYIVMWLASMVILLFARFQYGEVDQFGYSDELSQGKLVYAIGGLVAVVVVSSLLVSGLTRSAIFVPQPSLALTIGSLNLSSVVNDLFYQLALVSNSEETMVLSFSQVLRKKLATTRLRNVAAPTALIIPRAGWAVLHGYVSYSGPLMPILILSAFISGMIISYAAYNSRVKSFLVAVLIHFGFNSIVVLQSAVFSGTI